MPKACVIRTARVDDMPAVIRLSDAVQTLHASARPDIFHHQAQEDGRNSFFQMAMKEDNWAFWVATHDEEVNGYLMCEVITKSEGPIRRAYQEGHIHQISVAERARRTGIGSALLANAINALNARGCDRITVAYWAFNPTSEAFFQSAGFDPVLITAELGQGKP